jgi:hypothetical protein
LQTEDESPIMWLNLNVIMSLVKSWLIMVLCAAENFERTVFNAVSVLFSSLVVTSTSIVVSAGGRPSDLQLQIL